MKTLMQTLVLSALIAAPYSYGSPEVPRKYCAKDPGNLLQTLEVKADGNLVLGFNGKDHLLTHWEARTTDSLCDVHVRGAIGAPIIEFMADLYRGNPEIDPERCLATSFDLETLRTMKGNFGTVGSYLRLYFGSGEVDTGFKPDSYAPCSSP